MHTKTVASLVASALLAQSASISHSHLHKKAPAAASVKLADNLSNLNIRDGKNLQASADVSTWGVAIGDATDESIKYKIKFTNNAGEDLNLILWSASSANNASSLYSKQTVNNPEMNPDINQLISANDSLTVSFNPALYGDSISAGFAPFYKNSRLNSNNGGQINDTYGELTFQTDSMWSTIDVSRLVNMYGSNMTIDVYDSEATANEDPLCYSTMTDCVYLCDPFNTPSGTCYNGTATNCETVQKNGAIGGCMGMWNAQGYIEVSFNGGLKWD